MPEYQTERDMDGWSDDEAEASVEAPEEESEGVNLMLQCVQRALH